MLLRCRLSNIIELPVDVDIDVVGRQRSRRVQDCIRMGLEALHAGVAPLHVVAQAYALPRLAAKDINPPAP